LLSFSEDGWIGSCCCSSLNLNVFLGNQGNFATETYDEEKRDFFPSLNNSQGALAYFYS
jgi:hypothetical protein